MLRSDAETMLKQYDSTAYPKEICRINHRVTLFTGFGHSNAVAIEGASSWILVDPLDSDARAERLKQELRQIADKPVKTIIFTHGHIDHRGGSGAFAATVEEVIAFAPKNPPLRHFDKLAHVLEQRTARQFGYALCDEECITQGLGIREGAFVGDGKRLPLEPTTIYQQDIVRRTIDGVPLELVAAPGETDDQLFIWLPEDQVLCCGDNYYGCFPNLYAIRGSQYRDIATWVHSLDCMLTYPAETLLPGHTKPILGAEAIREVLGNYRSALEFILLHTLACMDAGMSESQAVEAVRLPQELASLPYLQEFYGTVAWSVRSVYNGYFGWFDGNPSNLAKLPDQVFHEKLLSLIGPQRLKEQIEQSLASQEYQMAVQLCDIALQGGCDIESYRQLKARGLLGLAGQMTSANGRHYCIASAKELLETE